MDNWTLGSTMIGIGLNWYQSILVIFAGQLIASIFKAINSRCGAVYHLGYPVISRSVFGMYGAYYVVFARAVLALIYYAIKGSCVQNVACVDLMLIKSFSLRWVFLRGQYASSSLW